MEGREKERDHELSLLKKNDTNNTNRVTVMLFKCHVLQTNSLHTVLKEYSPNGLSKIRKSDWPKITLIALITC